MAETVKMLPTEIVTKMRDLANLLLIDGHRERSDAAEEAADQIARLHAEIERLTNGIAIWKECARTADQPLAFAHGANAALRAEIERLRSALEEIKSLGGQKKGSASYAMASIARAALAHGGDK